jgi:hypothetical protein
MKLFERGVGEAGADVADVAPGLTLAHREHQGTEAGARPPRCGEPDYHNLLATRGLDLEPVGAAGAGPVEAGGALGHDAFQTRLLRLLEDFRAVLRDVLAEGQQPMLGQDAAQALLARDQGQSAQVLARKEHQIERAVEERGLGPQCVLQELKARDAVRIEGNELAIDHGVLLDLFEGLGDRLVAVADDLAVAGIERDLAALDAGDHAKAVPFGLEDPIRVIEGSIGKRCQHRLEVLGKLGLACHVSKDGKGESESKAAPRAASAQQGLAHARQYREGGPKHLVRQSVPRQRVWS